MTTLKPKRTAFLFRTIFSPILFLLALAIAAGITGVIYAIPWAPIAAGAAWLLLAILIMVQGFARFRKEHYEIHPDRIVVRRGGLVSDQELEVHYPNITHVKWIRPWLSHKLFGIGDVYIEVAGSAAGSIAFRSISDSDQVQQAIRENMKQAFSMSTDELLHEEGPATLGIIIDIPLKGGWAILVAIYAIASELIPMMGTLQDAGVQPSASGLIEHAGWLLLGIPVFLIAAAVITLRCLDLKRRSYRVYNGVIEYHEGFLTRNDAFMPVENLSNSEVTRGIAERITNLYNVVVSCQGAGQEVSFLYLQRGPELDAVLDQLIDKTKTAPKAPPPVTSDGLAAPIPGPPPLPPKPAAPDQTYRMHPGRTLASMAGLILLIPLLFVASPLLLVFLYQAVLQVVKIFRTTYTLRANSVEEKFDFIQVKQREFTKDKITGVVFRENLLDRMFKTITIQFWSIGAGREIVFRNLKKTDELIAAVRERANVQFSEPTETIASQHGFGRYLLANIPGMVFLLLLVVAAIVAAQVVDQLLILLTIVPVILFFWGYIWGIIYYPRSKLDIHAQGLTFHRGVISRQKTCARYQHIKDITTTKIPGINCGSMRFNVAGERAADQAGTKVPYGFTMRYVPEILSKDELFDYQILAQAEASNLPTQETIEARKALGNTTVRTLLTSIILVPFIALLPITLPIALWRAHLVRYRIEPGRVLKRTGRLYRSQTSILFTRIDHIQTSRGALNKMFGNGNIAISTAGSSRPELVLRDVKEHEAFYNALKAAHRTE